ncbi:hypothetical protein FEZ63_16865 [Microvirga brassicacearum]|uniref:Uncharacterized protein n=1 Tax=Microvirga brassicacearum TaxID=2580413 RepID=A0A5N3P7I0_9HYPH|nr:hypothetical protein FEZ63_16865 [Microvirga brassicacearum]
MKNPSLIVSLRRDSLFCSESLGGAAMMGVQAEPARLFYDFRLDDHVPDNHFLRGRSARPANHWERPAAGLARLQAQARSTISTSAPPAL